jgi:peptidoglycan/xylan/chitin deacetylase (PgdA/CDA1 family)
MVADGHELGSHSFFHPLFTDIPPIQMTNEITYTEAAIAWAVGEYVPMRYFRFPYAGKNDATRRHVASLGYQSSFWDIDPRGWDPGKTAQDVVAHVQNRAHPGGTIIMHCSSVDDLNALPGVIQAVRDLGLSLGTVSEVLTPEDRDVPGYQLLPNP